MDMLTLMHEAEPYGHLMVGDMSPDAEELAGLLGGSAEEVEKLLNQLERRKVFSRNEHGVIYSRRMTRDLDKSKLAVERGKLGGNPRLVNGHQPPDPLNPKVKPKRGNVRSEVKREDNQGVKREDNPGVKPHGFYQSPESRLQESSSKHLESTVPREDAAPPDRVVQFTPRVTDPPGKWLHLSAQRECDPDDMVTHAVVGGTYLDVAARLVCDAAKINPVSWAGDWRPLIKWLEAGADLHDLILPVVRKRAERPNYQPPASLEWYSREIMDLLVPQPQRAAQ